MGLGFLHGGGLQGHYRITYSGEANPIFVRTLRENHGAFERATCLERASRTPESVEPVDLRSKSALERAEAAARTSDLFRLSDIVGGRVVEHQARDLEQLLDVRAIELPSPNELQERASHLLRTVRGRM